MNIRELKRYLEEYSKDDLINDIIDLFKKNSFVKDYYSSKFAADGDLSILVKYKDQIKNEFFPKKGDGRGRLFIAKKAITEFKKISNSKTDLAEIMIFYVEIGVDYTCTYGDIDERFYSSMEGMFEEVLIHVTEHKLEDKFRDRLKKVTEDTSGIGWGFHDQLCELFYTYIE